MFKVQQCLWCSRQGSLVNSISLNDDIGTARCYDIASWDAIFFLDILDTNGPKI